MNLSQFSESDLLQAHREPPQFEDIELDEAEMDEALRVAREQKFYRIQRARWAEKIAQAETYQRHTAEQLFNHLLEALPSPPPLGEPEGAYTRLLKNLCCYFSADPRFKGDLNKGLLLLGNVGTGKTTLMKLFMANQLHSYRVVSMLEITGDYKSSGKDSGEDAVKPYYANYRTSPNRYGKTEHGYCFDDVGTEEVPARHYGESKNVFAEIIQLRYNNRAQVPFNSTHATSNKDAAELEALYGSRCYDRMKEMFNVITLNHGSLRG